MKNIEQAEETLVGTDLVFGSGLPLHHANLAATKSQTPLPVSTDYRRVGVGKAFFTVFSGHH